MNYKNKKKSTLRDLNGFTLIELLVVIAIIGILASIVILNMNDTKKSARDVVIKNHLLEATNKAEIYADGNSGSYLGLCNNIPEIAAGGVLNQAIIDNGGSFVCGDDIDGFCFSSTLNRGGSGCIDHYRELVSGFECDGTGLDTLCD